MKKWIKVFLFLFFSCATVGSISFCAPSYENIKIDINKPSLSPPQRYSIAVTPVQISAPGAMRVGQGIDDMLIVALMQTSCFKILERKEIEKVLREQGLQIQDIFDEKTAVRVGRLVGAKYILLNYLAQYSPEIKTGGTAFHKNYYQQVNIVISSRIVDVEKGEVIVAANGMGEWKKAHWKWQKSSIYDVDPGAGEVDQDVINNALQNAINDLANNIAREIKRVHEF